MQTNIELVYDVLSSWFSKFDGIHDVCVKFSEMGLEIGATWTLGERVGSYRYVIPRQIMENAEAEFFPLCEKSILEKIETSHMVWEVGEE